ncbi:MAG: YihY/virulence factor BrkB family protein [Acidimicrobiia bacterium]
MSTAALVPTTHHLDGSDIRGTIADASLGKLVTDSFIRFRRADGFSFARAMAFQTVLTLVPGTIAVVALAAWMGESTFQSVLREAITSLAPGPAGEFFNSAFRQGTESGDGGNHLVVIIASVGAMLFSAVPAMAQLQRGASRIYGVDSDRPTLQRYTLAVVLTLSVGALMVVAFVSIVLGSALGGSNDGFASTWSWLRWPLGVGVLATGLAALFKFAPNRRQPSLAWLLLGGGVAVIAWLLVSIGLSLFLNASTTFGDVYGPLAGFVGVMIWAVLSSIGVFFGLAVAAQLEAERAGSPGPVDES